MTQRRGAGAAPRVGFFGILGLGNIGNEASLEAMLAYIRGEHPDAVLDAMTGGAEQFRKVYGMTATPINWYEGRTGWAGKIGRLALNASGRIVDPLRIIAWVRKHDVVIVPGMGVLEATLPLRAYGFPIYMYALCAGGKLFQVKVALVSVGANVIKQRATRWLFAAAAKMAYYRSYRDDYSRDAIRSAGVDTSRDRVFTDLAFSFPTPPYEPGDQKMVGIGVHDYHGGNDDRARAAEIHSAYVEKMTEFTCWLIENGYSARFFGGDASCDFELADHIVARVGKRLPGMDASKRLVVMRSTSYTELLSEMNLVGTVVATRFHNVLGAIKLSKPTVSIGYSRKFIALMESTGLSEFTQPTSELAVDKLIRQFEEVRSRQAELVPGMQKRNAANAESLAEQFDLLSAVLFS